MSADHSARCDRVDARFRRAHELVAMWINGNREHVLRELSFAERRTTGKAAARMVAAIGTIGATDPTAFEILTEIAREKDR